MRAKDLGKIHDSAAYWLVPEKSNTTSISTSFVKQDNADTVLPASQVIITRITCKMYWKKRELKTDVANLLMDFSCITYKQ